VKLQEQQLQINGINDNDDELIFGMINGNSNFSTVWSQNVKGRDYLDRRTYLGGQNLKGFLVELKAVG
jgi:hypothetical protein